MRYSDDDRESSNIEDRRGQRGPMFRFPSGMGRGRGVRIPVGGKGGVSLGTILIIGIVLMVLGINPLELLTGGGGNYPQVPQMPRSEPSVGRDVAGRGSPSDIPGLPGGRTLQSDSDDIKRFVALVLADTEDVWNDVFKSIGRNYQEPSMVCSPTQRAPAAALALRRWGRSIARWTERSTSTCHSTISCAAASTRPATSRRPT